MAADVTARMDRYATWSLIVGTVAALVSIVFPGGPVVGAVAIFLGIRSVRKAPRTARPWQAIVGIALGSLSFLIIAGWAANGFK